jgi:predicted ATPase
MYTSFQIKNFRNFKDLTLTDLERINLITGLNNVGKTNLLEALFVYSGAYNPELIVRVNAIRGISSMKVESAPWADTPWDSFFYDFDTDKVAELIGLSHAGSTHQVRFRVIRDIAEVADNVSLQQAIRETEAANNLLELVYEKDGKSRIYYQLIALSGVQTVPAPPPSPSPVHFFHSRVRVEAAQDAERFSNLQSNRQLIVKALKIMEPSLDDIEVLVFLGTPMLHGKIQETSRPLALMGGGLTKLASLVLGIGMAAEGVVLIDEIENGFHHSVLPGVWETISQTARHFNTQVFATTHSFECISAAHGVFEKDSHYDFRLMRLERIDDDTRAITYDKESLDAAIEIGLEVR